LMRRGY